MSGCAPTSNIVCHPIVPWDEESVGLRIRLPAKIPAALAVLLLAVGGLAILGATSALAAAGSWVQAPHAQLRLLSAGTATGDSGEVRLGLQMRTDPGWKTYWRNPGDAGYPVSVDWSGSDNLADAGLLWPVPHRFSLFGFETFGYEGEVVLPIAADLRDPARPATLRAEVDYLVCADICVPGRASLELDLPAGPSQAAREAFLIDRFEARVPDGGARSGLGLTRSDYLVDGEEGRLTLRISSTAPLRDPDVIAETAAPVVFGKPVIAVVDGGRGASIEVPVLASKAGAALPQRFDATLTVTDVDRGMETRTTFLQVTAPAAQSPATLALMFLTALLGGLILNLMPCVLPVLSLKLLAVFRMHGAERVHVRRSFLAAAGGIVATFGLLAAALIVLRAGGAAVGWGFQFQQPAFLFAMAVVIALFSCNLLGLFEIPLPRFVAGWSERGPRHGLLGDFASGAFATLLATPCSAPFVGTAVGFALSSGGWAIVLIFVGLGLGMALPWLVVAAFPRLAGLLPRPGRWMIWLRRVFGVALAVTAVWLLSVMATQTGLVMTFGATALLLALLAVLAVVRTHRRPGVALAGGAVLVAVAVAATTLLPTVLLRAAPTAAAGVWQPLDLAAIDPLVAQGDVVVVDVTADWCLTCKVNKALVLDRGKVATALQSPGVVAMQGDWTSEDAAISAFLARYGRYGVPFNVVYGPAAPQGLPLPEILSETAVLEALRTASGG